MPTKEQLEQATELGRVAGRNAGSWAADGNTSADHIRRVLALLEDGDPQASDYLPTYPDLSGEWSDNPTPTSLAIEIMGHGASSDDEDELCSAFEDGVSETFESACEAELRAFLPSEDESV